jgi:VWFA-related protein
MTKTLGTIAAVVALAATVVARGWQAPPAFRAAADLVEVDVIVTDKNGSFVSDLAIDDFDVQEEGQAQQIQQFYLHLVDDQRKLQRRPEGTLAASAPPASSPRIFVVVFDDAHMTPAGFKRTQDAAIRLFSQQFLNGDVGGVVINRQMVNNRLTSEREELLKAVRNARPNLKSSSRLLEEREWPRLSGIEAVRIIVNNDRTVLEEAVSRACADDKGQCIVAQEEVQSKAARLASAGRVESAQTTQVLKTLMDGLAKIDGRKTVLLMSEGFVAEETWTLVQDTVSLAARANARIYTLDARGLDRGMSERLGGTDPGAADAGSRLLQQFDSGSDSINSLAVDTGGFVVRNTNIFDQAIARIAADAGNYYILGYRPTAALDGKFHKISVKVKRPGLLVRARRGYLASPRPVLVDSRPVVDPAAGANTGNGLQTVQRPATPPSVPEAGSSPIETPPASLEAFRSMAIARAPESAVVSAPDTAPGARAGEITGGSLRLRPDASRHVETLVNNAPVNAAATTGWEAYQRGDLEAARSALTMAAAEPSARPWVHYALGQASYGLRDYPSAVGAWERVRATTPEFEPVYFDLLDGYLQQKEYDKAVRVMREARERWPRDPEVLEALGVAQVWRNALDDAIGSFEQAVALSPDEGVGYFNLGKALELRYRASRRYVQQLRSWVANETDRKNAVASYERYVSLGGPFENAAREGLIRLGWVEKR